jgi:hypothetical protein
MKSEVKGTATSQRMGNTGLYFGLITVADDGDFRQTAATGIEATNKVNGKASIFGCLWYVVCCV